MNREFVQQSYFEKIQLIQTSVEKV
jgi:hypothetical protein